jgi:molybdate transport system substrate-binding protein
MRLRLIACAILALTLNAPAVSAEPVNVFAAASMKDAIEAAGAAFTAETGDEIVPVFASSSTAARQIEQGAPADLFVSANIAWMDYLEERDLILDGSRKVIAANALVLIAPAGAVPDPAPSLEGPDGLLALLGDEGRLAVGDPDHVPAGIYAKEALTSLGAWDALMPRLARAENVRVALALVSRGEVPLGIVYASDAAAEPGVAVVSDFPADSHAPIDYPAALVVRDGRPDAAAAFLDYLASEAGQAHLAAAGFRLP